MRVLIGAVAIALTLMAKAAMAQSVLAGFQNSKTLLEECTGTLSSSQTFCTGYILGVIDMGVHSGARICVPPTVTAGQVRAVIVKALQDKPESGEQLAATFVSLVALDKWKCQ